MYYFPDLSKRDQIEDVLGKRKEWMSDVKNKKDRSAIRFRRDMKDSPYLFLCDVWPDVNNQQPTCQKWNLTLDKYPLFQVKDMGAFRTLRHFYYYCMFKFIDPTYADYFLWSRRHDAACLYQMETKSSVDMAIMKERKRKQPSEKKINQMMAEWFLTKQNGLRAGEAKRLADWNICSKYLKNNNNMTHDEFKTKVTNFRNCIGIRTYAYGIVHMYQQDSRLYEALVNGTRGKGLFSVGFVNKEVWDVNSGHNMLGELHMHFRSTRKGFLKIYYDKKYSYGTAFPSKNNHDSTTTPLLTHETKKKTTTEKTKEEQEKKTQLVQNKHIYYKQLCDNMNACAQSNQWTQVEKIAHSIIYLSKYQ